MSSKSNLLLISCLICFIYFVQQVESKKNFNVSHPIENPKRWFYQSAGEACARAVKEDDLNCTAKYLQIYKDRDEKSYCCYYHAMYNCLDSAIKSKCDLAIYRNFKADKLFAATSEAIIFHDCPNYANYSACMFPLKKVLIICSSVFAVILIILALVLYRHYRTGFHKVNTNISYQINNHFS